MRPGYPYRNALTWLRDLMVTLKMSQMIELAKAIDYTGIEYWDALCMAGTVLQRQKARATSQGIRVM